MSRIRNAIRVLMGQKTTEEQVLLIRLDVAEYCLESAVEKMSIIENMAHDVRISHKMAIVNYEKLLEELRDQLIDRRAKVKDLKRIIALKDEKRRNWMTIRHG